MENRVFIITVGKSHLLQDAIQLADLGYRITLITFWPRFKFPNNLRVISLFLVYWPFYFFRKQWMENFAFGFLRMLKFKGRVIIDQNLAHFVKSDNVIIDCPTCSLEHQEDIWRKMELQCGCTSQRLMQQKTRGLLSYNAKNMKNCRNFVVPSESALKTYPLNWRDKGIVRGFARKDISITRSYNRRLKVLLVGVVDCSKNFHFVISSLKLYRDNIDSIDIFGEVLDRDYLDYLTDLADGMRIEFHGSIDQVELFQKFGDYDVGIVSSMSEGMSLSGVQMLEKSLPVIGHRLSGLEVILGPEYTWSFDEDFNRVFDNLLKEGYSLEYKGAVNDEISSCW